MMKINRRNVIAATLSVALGLSVTQAPAFADEVQPPAATVSKDAPATNHDHGTTESDAAQTDSDAQKTDSTEKTPDATTTDTPDKDPVEKTDDGVPDKHDGHMQVEDQDLSSKLTFNVGDSEVNIAAILAVIAALGAGVLIGQHLGDLTQPAKA